MMQMGYAPEDWVGKPVDRHHQHLVGHAALPRAFQERVEDVKRGVLQAGGFPVELPALSLSESFVKPTTMLYRNMLAMETEELLRSHPVDGAVLMGGCDKTTPGAADGRDQRRPAGDLLPAGPMLRGNWKGKVLGSGSDAWKYWDERRAGKITEKDWVDVEAGIARSYGTCMTMGTAAHHDRDRRGDRHDAARRLLDPGRRRQPHPHGGRMRPAHRRDGVGGPDAGADPDPQGVRERHRGRDGDGLLDQRHHPSHRAWRAAPASTSASTTSTRRAARCR